jgi:ABC-type phosphate/phosphonate transport system permease subunit
MPKHVISHGSSSFVSTLFAAFMVEYFKPHFPSLFKHLDKMSFSIARVFPPDIPIEIVEIAIVATFFALIWGLVFRIKFVDS